MTTPERHEAEEVFHLTRRLDQLKRNCEAMLATVHFRYGAGDDRTLRAQELCNYLQRLRWALALDGDSNRLHLVSRVANPKGTLTARTTASSNHR
jgi:hypothetical protein